MKFKKITLVNIENGERVYSPANGEDYLIFETKNEYFIFDREGVGQMFQKYELSDFVFVCKTAPPRHRLLRKRLSFEQLQQLPYTLIDPDEFFLSKNNKTWDDLMDNVKHQIYSPQK